MVFDLGPFLAGLATGIVLTCLVIWAAVVINERRYKDGD